MIRLMPVLIKYNLYYALYKNESWTGIECIKILPKHIGMARITTGIVQIDSGILDVCSNFMIESNSPFFIRINNKGRQTCPLMILDRVFCQHSCVLVQIKQSPIPAVRWWYQFPNRTAMFVAFRDTFWPNKKICVVHVTA